MDSILPEKTMPSESQIEEALRNLQACGMTLNGAKCFLGRVAQDAMERVARAETLKEIYAIAEEK